jgi:Flp pilus assembly protein TadD
VKLPTSSIGVVAVAAVSAAACGSPLPATDGEPIAAPVTFARHVAPILHQHCAPCHRPGGPAPFGLLSYQDARQRARTIVEMTRSRRMPPWLPEPGHGEFAGARRLTDGEIQTLARWLEEGASEGAAADLPPAPKFPDGWRLGTPDVIVKLPQAYTLAAGGPEVWRNFVIPIPVSTTRYVRTVELNPGRASFVHHALMGVDSTRSSRRRDARDGEPGFDGMDMGDAQAPDGHLLGWTPGMTPFPGVDGKAWRLEPGTDLILQLHMVPSGKVEAANPTVGLYFSDAPPVGAPMHLLRLDADSAIDIPAGEQRFTVFDAFRLPVDVDVLAAYPHAHFLATTMEGDAVLPDGSVVRLIRIDDWDFKWQDVYRYAKPVSLPKGTTIRMRYAYDNSSGNPRNPHRPPKRVVAGMRSSDEMAHLQLQVQTRTVSDLASLKEAASRHALAKNPRDPWPYYELGNALRERGDAAGAIDHYRAALERDPNHAAAHNNLGTVLAAVDRDDDAIREYREALRVEPDFADAHYNFANSLRSAGRLDEAITHYRDALKSEPHFASARNNLGQVLGSQGKLDAAIVEFREAVRIDPGSAEAHNNLGAGLGLLGRFDEAIAHLREALRLEPEHAGARENLQIALERAAGR